MKPLRNNQEHTLKSLDSHLSKLLLNENSGHDMGHIQRVVAMAKAIADESVNLFVILVAAYLHEFYDDKVEIFPTKHLQDLEVLWNLDFEGHLTEVDAIIRSVGYKGGFEAKVFPSQEAKVVSDADVLDAMGAMGIARTFYYAGNKGLPFHDRALEGVIAQDYDSYRNQKRNAIAHFDEKLLKLNDYLATAKGKEIGALRHERLKAFYEAFNEEVKMG